jgi:precorrin-2 dehydrogenase / sirohydrochlorin ferrochelatase
LLSILLTTDDSALALVVGAGAVGLRKCAVLRAAGWRVRIVDPRVKTVPDRVELIATKYHPSLLTDARLVVACTGHADVNAQVLADALDQGKLVCDTMEPTRGNFVFPATWSHGPVQLALTTGGAAPALAKRLVRELGESLPPNLPEFVGLLAELREIVLDKISDESTRRALLRRLASAEFQERAERDGVDRLRRQVLDEIDKTG